MKTYHGKPSWDNDYKLDEKTGQWTPPPEWATHILLAEKAGRYAWAEKSATGHFVGEPRYRDGVQSRDIFTVGPGGWQVVEARPAPASQRLNQALVLLDAEYKRLQEEANRRNSAYDHYGMDNTPETVNGAICRVRELLQQELWQERAPAPVGDSRLYRRPDGQTVVVGPGEAADHEWQFLKTLPGDTRP